MSRRSSRIQGIAPEVSTKEAQQSVQHRQREQKEKPTSRPTPRTGPAQAGGRGRGSGSGHHAEGQPRQASTQTEKQTARTSTDVSPLKDEQAVIEAVRNIAYRARQDRQASSSSMEQQEFSISSVLGKRQRDTTSEDEGDNEEQERKNRARYRHRMQQMSIRLHEPPQMARKPFIDQYKDRIEDELEVAIAEIYDFLREGSGERNRDPCIVQERTDFLNDWSTRIRDYQLVVMTKMVATHQYQELIWKWEEIYDDCANLANTPVDENDIAGHQARAAQFVMHAEELINDGILKLPDIVAHFQEQQ
ncbi:hypothetical protein BDB00DRAFT_868315 [Zychaea mexicana]|uniref:uncharacterized protein n=1 Tax=Zychaea mexicana TaxID=64656 RepID=UPI0022FE9CE3|nr:uncharacterized protein BDB00DRAFT_868315 [Zychaea mexicana]KAI9497711.1 hypothetical protein BDB00DRAFT_868315 [Zychaea mexicana]